MLNILSSGPRSRMLEISFDNVPCSSLFNGVKEGSNEARFKYSFWTPGQENLLHTSKVYYSIPAFWWNNHINKGREISHSQLTVYSSTIWVRPRIIGQTYIQHKQHINACIGWFLHVRLSFPSQTLAHSVIMQSHMLSAHLWEYRNAKATIFCIDCWLAFRHLSNPKNSIRTWKGSIMIPTSAQPIALTTWPGLFTRGNQASNWHLHIPPLVYFRTKFWHHVQQLERHF